MTHQLTLFGEEVTGAKELKKTKAEVFEDYDGFLDKFKTKKTTDDCYTPPAVYDAVLRFVDTRVQSLQGFKVVRPFYPGGDYEEFAYPDNAVVVDNPPFSLLSRILRFYSIHKMPFFLFGPSLTLFSATDCDLTYLITDSDIIYANGAKVNTGFITNMVKDLRVWVCPELREMIKAAQVSEPKTKHRFIYPDHLITAATLNKLADHGVEFKVRKDESKSVKNCDDAKRHGRALFGAGFLISDRAAAERAAAERAVAERAPAERAAAERAAAERAAAERAAATVLQLSPREWHIIEQLNRQSINNL